MEIKSKTQIITKVTEKRYNEMNDLYLDFCQVYAKITKGSVTETCFNQGAETIKKMKDKELIEKFNNFGFSGAVKNNRTIVTRLNNCQLNKTGELYKRVSELGLLRMIIVNNIREFILFTGLEVVRKQYKNNKIDQEFLTRLNAKIDISEEEVQMVFGYLKEALKNGGNVGEHYVSKELGISRRKFVNIRNILELRHEKGDLKW